MIAKPHICSSCKKEVVYTDCLPATCYLCNAITREQGDIDRREFRAMTQDAVKLVNKRTEKNTEKDNTNPSLAKLLRRGEI